MPKFSEIVKQNLDCSRENIRENQTTVQKHTNHEPEHQRACLQQAQRPLQRSPQRLLPPLRGCVKASFSPEARSPPSSHQLLIDELASKQDGDANKNELLQYSAQQRHLPLCPPTQPPLLSPSVQGRLLHVGSGPHPFLLCTDFPLLQMCTPGPQLQPSFHSILA